MNVLPELNACAKKQRYLEVILICQDSQAVIFLIFLERQLRNI